MPNVHAFPKGAGILAATVSTGTQLVRFLVTGNYNDVESPPLGGATNMPLFNTINATATFYPRVPAGFVTWVTNLDQQSSPEYSADTALALAPVEASIVDGVLVSNVVGDTVGIQLLANTSNLNLAAQNIPALYYDISFTNVVFAGANQVLMNWAFIASTDSTPINLTDPNLTRYPYEGPL